MSLIDRLKLATYEDEEPVGFGVGKEGQQESDLSSDSWFYMPEPIFARVLHLAAAYGLHHLSNIDASEDTHLNATQCQGLADELLFLGNTIPSDGALSATLKGVLDQLALIARRSGSALFVSPP